MFPVRCSSISRSGPRASSGPPRVQVRLCQHAAAIVAQAYARVIEVGARGVHAHVGARAVFGSGMAHPGARTRRLLHGHVVHGVLTVIHGHSAMIHAVHPGTHGAHHVGHGQPFGLVECGDGCGESRTRGERAAGEAGAIHRLGEDRVGIVCRFDDHVIGLTRPEAEFVHRDRLDVLAVRLTTVNFSRGIRTS